MELNRIYTDNYNNKCKVISDDFTGLNRGIVYVQFIDRVDKSIEQKVFVNRIKNNITTPHIFAVWECNFKNYKLID